MIEITTELIKTIADEMDIQSEEMETYLDLETGETIMIIDEIYVGVMEDQPSKEEMEDNPERYRLIPAISSREGWQFMADFADKVADRSLHSQFANALNRKGAFRNFRDVLDEVDLLEEWYAYKNGRLLERAEEWLRGEMEE
jgi:hypothetical protein